MEGLLQKVVRGWQAIKQVCLICLTMRITVSEKWVSVQPATGDHVDRLLYHFWRQSLCQECICLLKGTGYWKQYMILNGRKRAAATRKKIIGTVMKVERRSMIDEHQSPVPEKHVGIARSAIHIGDIGIEPND